MGTDHVNSSNVRAPTSGTRSNNNSFIYELFESELVLLILGFRGQHCESRNRNARMAEHCLVSLALRT